jgi:hypothetical protein
MSISSIAIPNMARHYVVGMHSRMCSACKMILRWLCHLQILDPCPFATTIGRAAVRLAENSAPSTSHHGPPYQSIVIPDTRPRSMGPDGLLAEGGDDNRGGLGAGEVLLTSDQIAVAHRKAAPHARLNVVGADLLELVLDAPRHDMLVTRQ